MVRPIIELLMTRRSKDSVLKLPDGQLSFLRARIPPAIIHMEEVRYNSGNEKKLNEFYQIYKNGGEGGRSSA